MELDGYVFYIKNTELNEVEMKTYTYLDIIFIWISFFGIFSLIVNK
jgi:hypothetical protein